jgi:hypothetical protein
MAAAPLLWPALRYDAKVMSVLRLVIACLVMAALPLQGIAAASMLFCEQAAHATVSQPSGHDHASHGHGDDGSAKAEQFAKQGVQQTDSSQAKSGLADDGHACPICASCCNLVALTEAPILSFAGDSPTAEPLQGPARVFTRHAPAPDKPPRA